MDYSAESLMYLRIAYTVLLVGQGGYVVWLVQRWRQTTRKLQEAERSR